MGRAEKYADVIDKYEKGIKQLEEIEKKDKDLEEEKEEKLSVTREIKYEELQKEIDNSVTIADYEEMTDMEEAPKKKEITDTSEIQVEDVPEEIDNLIQYDYRRYGINVLLFYKYKECDEVVYSK